MLLSLETHSTFWSKSGLEGHRHNGRQEAAPARAARGGKDLCHTLGWSHVEFETCYLLQMKNPNGGSPNIYDFHSL